MKDFWDAIDAQIAALESTTTVDAVLAICPTIPGTSSGDGFFEGSGGDKSVLGALKVAGWKVVRYRAHYYWAAQAPDGSMLTYVEGDLYRGNKVPPSEEDE